MKRLLLIPLLVTLYACDSPSVSTPNGPVSALVKPQVFSLKTDTFYAVNVITQKPIIPVVTTLGDTVQAGKPYSMTSKRDEYFKPEAAYKSNAQLIPLNTNLWSQPSNKIGRTVPVSWSKNNSPEGKSHFAEYVLTNSYNEQVQTGTPLKITGQKSDWYQERPVTSLPMALSVNSFSNIQSLDVDQGLHSSYILSIIEDKKHNLWFGSYGGGVARYDGSSFTLFNESNSNVGNIIKVLFEDSQGNIWMGSTGRGLCKFDGTEIEFISEEHGMPSEAITGIVEDREGHIWISSSRGVSRFDGTYFVHFSKKEGLVDEFVQCIEVDQSNNVWVGTENGISVYKNGQWTNFNYGTANQAHFVVKIKACQDGSIWFSSIDEGIYRYNNDSLIHYNLESELASNFIWTIQEDKVGNVWFGSDGHGVIKFDGQQFTSYLENDGYPSTVVRSIYEDERNNLWFGTYGKGVLKYNPNSFQHFNKYNGLSNSIARSIIEDTNGHIWFGTSGGGVCVYEGQFFYQLENNQHISSAIIKTLYQTRDGKIWLGTNGNGLFSFDGTSLTQYEADCGFPSKQILCLTEDHAGNLWIGTDGQGVIKANRNEQGDIVSIDRINEAEGLSNIVVAEIYEDNHNYLWFVTDGGGLNKYDGKSNVNITEENGLSHRNALTLTQDQFGNYWCGTYGGGINIFDDEHIVHLTMKNGLVDNMIWSVQEIVDSGKSEFWITTEHGINLIELSTQTQNPGVADYEFKINSFTKQDGLIGMDYYSNSVCLDSKKRIWWGSGKGVEMLDLTRFKTSEETPEPRLNYLEINENFIDFRSNKDSLMHLDFDSIVPFYNYPRQLTLPYTHNHITFHFSAIDWYAPHKIRYQFRLLGLEEEWSNASSKNEADFRSLPYGTYTFQVRCAGESQKWSEPFSYSFTILPPWWHTWWFRFMVATVILCVLYVLYRARTRALIERQRSLEKTVQERTAEVVQQKELIEEKHREITDSINYAERIQRSFLATKELLDAHLKEYFVLFLPKDIVSGDFYWASQLANGNFALVTADSTGHGVPGAIMSILNISSLESAVKEKLSQPDDLFNYTRREIINRLKKDGSAEGGKDGMDASLICFNFESGTMKYAAANNPVWVLRDGDILEFPADKMPVGKHDKQDTPFTAHEVQLKNGDIVYTFTDGLPDQFGGEKGKKFMYKRFKDLLISLANESMPNQQIKLKEAFLNWKGTLEQVDDVCVIGVRI